MDRKYAYMKNFRTLRNTIWMVRVLSHFIHKGMTKRILQVVACVILVCVAGCAMNPNLQGARGDLDNKDHQRALRKINRALETAPNNPEVHQLKGDILYEIVFELPDTLDRTRYLPDLVRAYRRAQDLDPGRSVHVTKQLSTLYDNEYSLGLSVFLEADQLGGRRRANRFMRAAQYFRNASIIFPDSSEARLNEATAYYNAGEAPKAALTYERAIALGSTGRDLFTYLARTYELMGTEVNDFETQQGYFRSMVRTLQTARKYHGEDKEIRMMLLNAYAMSGLDQEALSFFEEVFPLEKENQVYLYNYGTLLLRRGDNKGAIHKLSHAVALDSSYAKAVFNLGAAYVNHGFDVYKQLEAVRDSLQMEGQNRGSMEIRMAALDRDRKELFQQAIIHLESARYLLENEPEGIASVCRALYQAYAQMNQRARAEEANTCAGLSEG